MLPGYSASGQDVWLTPNAANIFGPGLVLSAVGARCGRVFMADHARWGVVANTTAFRVLPGCDIRFAWYTLNSSSFWEKGGAAQPYVRIEESLRKYLPLPPLGEQRLIADFLDQQTSGLNHACANRERQISLIEERALSQIYDAVRGVREADCRKPSGLRWLGDIPASWPVWSVFSQFEVHLGKMINQARTEGDYLKPYLRNANVQWDQIDTSDLLVMDFPPSEKKRYELKAGDLLICEGGQPGRAAIWDGEIDEIYYQKALHRVRSRGRSLPRWLYYCLRIATALNIFSVGSNIATISHLTAEQLRSHRFPFPDPATQESIAAFLDDCAASDHTLVNTLRRQISLLEERRQALITAAVTGQFDVSTARGAEL